MRFEGLIPTLNLYKNMIKKKALQNLNQFHKYATNCLKWLNSILRKEIMSLQSI